MSWDRQEGEVPSSWSITRTRACVRMQRRVACDICHARCCRDPWPRQVQGSASFHWRKEEFVGRIAEAIGHWVAAHANASSCLYMYWLISHCVMSLCGGGGATSPSAHLHLATPTLLWFWFCVTRPSYHARINLASTDFVNVQGQRAFAFCTYSTLIYLWACVCRL